MSRPLANFRKRFHCVLLQQPRAYLSLKRHDINWRCLVGNHNVIHILGEKMDRINRSISTLSFQKSKALIITNTKATMKKASEWEFTLKGGGGLNVCRHSVVLTSQTYSGISKIVHQKTKNWKLKGKNLDLGRSIKDITDTQLTLTVQSLDAVITRLPSLVKIAWLT